MATLTGAPGQHVAMAAEERCFHCAEPLPDDAPRLRLQGQWRRFCCDGCAAAAEWIGAANLDDYYRLRSENAARVGEQVQDYSAWDRDAVLAEHAHDVPGGREITLLSDGMRCAACAWLIDKALSREDGVLEAGANAVTGRIRIAWDPQRTRLSKLLQRLALLGYRPYLATGVDREAARRRERRRWLFRIGIAGIGMMQAMMYAEALYLDFDNTMPIATRDFLRWITFLVSTPVVFYAGWPFLEGMWREVRSRALGMDTLIAGSTLLAYFASLVETIRGGPHIWYDAAVMFVFLLLVARMLEQRARNIASAQVDALARARPALAVRETDDGARESVPVAQLQPGDVIWIGSGETVPADGRLLDADAHFEEALLTGEARPVHRHPGEPVLAGAIARERAARVRVEQVGSATRLAELTRLVEHAQAQRPPLAAKLMKLSGYFVIGLFIAAALVYLGWRMHQPERAFEVMLAVLVVSCPCALSLAVPTALATAHGAAARLGVLSIGAQALERLSTVDDVVFDKTGTLSDGAPALADIDTFDGFDADAALAIAAALEQGSTHPLAQAFAHVPVPMHAQGVTTAGGQGLEGTVEGRQWRLGQAGFAAGRDDDGGIWLGDGSRGVARFRVREAAREDAAAAVKALREAGLRVHLCSGDGEASVADFAARVGIEATLSRQTPEAKLAFVRRLQAEGRRVTMVGDGINDAPVLAGADVSIAIGQGAALAQRAADLVLTGGSLMRIPQAVALAHRTRRIIRENLAWALAYNVIALPIAATGLVTPWMAAIGMAGSSLIVTLNALRLTRGQSAARHQPAPPSPRPSSAGSGGQA
ncbi:MAG: heavy metal translocating P-type ATPase [Pseudoxanthomonas suwonensis]|nr:heavy metal translocating P-type ATPase [Pseudoxanthomonas suwonensis]